MDAGAIVRSWRKLRDLSQADAAEAAGVSTRHLSFIETGRTMARRDTLLAIANSLHMPQAERDKLLLAAGHAPEPRPDAMSQSVADRAQTMSQRLLTTLESCPALMLDSAWNITDSNDAYANLLSAVAPGVKGSSIRSNNLMHLFFDPHGLNRHIVDWPHLSAMLMLMLRKQAVGKPTDDPIHELTDEVSRWAGDEGGREIREPYALSSIGARVAFQIDGAEQQVFHFTTLNYSAPFTVQIQSSKFAVFVPEETPPPFAKS